jgi:hypothetical protein
MRGRNNDPEFVAAFLESMAAEMAEFVAKPHNKLAEDINEARTLAKAWRTAATLIRKGVFVDAGNGVAAES